MFVCSAFGKTIALDGEWQIRVDEQGEGVEQKYFAETFSGKSGILPGTNYENLKDASNGKRDMGNFSEPRSYRGSIRYQREIEVDDLAKKYVLFMECCGWESFVWVNGNYVGTHNSLLAPHEYKLPMLLYKAEIKAFLYTLEWTGFQLLSLQDYPGQRTSPVRKIKCCNPLRAEEIRMHHMFSSPSDTLTGSTSDDIPQKGTGVAISFKECTHEPFNSSF